MKLNVKVYLRNRVKIITVQLDDEPPPVMMNFLDEVEDKLAQKGCRDPQFPDTYVIEKNNGDKYQFLLGEGDLLSIKMKYLSEWGIEENSLIIAYRNPARALTEAVAALNAKEVRRLLAPLPEISPVPRLQPEDINRLSINQHHLLFYLVKRVSYDGSLQVLKYLLAAGAKAGIRDAKGRTPLMLLIKRIIKNKIVGIQDVYVTSMLIDKMVLPDLIEVRRELEASLSNKGIEVIGREHLEEMLTCIKKRENSLKEAKISSLFFGSSLVALTSPAEGVKVPALDVEQFCAML